MQTFGRLLLTQPGGDEQEYVLEKSTSVLGRSTTSDIMIHDAQVSRAHARLECGAAGCTINDLGSTNGMTVNGQRVERALLAPGDVIGVGHSTLRLEVDKLELEADTIPIESEADLDATLAQATVPIVLANTHVPRLVIHTAEKTWEVSLLHETFSIGRHESNDLALDQGHASRRHARIERTGNEFRIRDLGSTNGTWLGPRRIDEHIL